MPDQNPEQQSNIQEVLERMERMKPVRAFIQKDACHELLELLDSAKRMRYDLAMISENPSIKIDTAGTELALSNLERSLESLEQEYKEKGIKCGY